MSDAINEWTIPGLHTDEAGWPEDYTDHLYVATIDPLGVASLVGLLDTPAAHIAHGDGEDRPTRLVLDHLGSVEECAVLTINLN